MNKRLLILLAGSVMFLLLAAGCSQQPKYVAPKLDRKDAAVLKLYLEREKSGLLYDPIYIIGIDGLRFRSSNFRSFMGEHDLILAPGVHTIVVGYDDGRKYSTTHAEIIFAAEAGKQYYVRDWPPVLLDYQSDQKVPYKVRGTPK